MLKEFYAEGYNVVKCNKNLLNEEDIQTAFTNLITTTTKTIQTNQVGAYELTNDETDFDASKIHTDIDLNELKKILTGKFVLICFNDFTFDIASGVYVFQSVNYQYRQSVGFYGTLRLYYDKDFDKMFVFLYGVVDKTRL